MPCEVPLVRHHQPIGIRIKKQFESVLISLTCDARYTHDDPEAYYFSLSSFWSI
jgi:hypothetical protein